jgi:hypothetical protein
MTTQNDGRNDFDFLVGTWKVHHRMLKARLKGSTEWIEFEGETVLRKILNGIGNIDENVIHMPNGPVSAISLRLFNPASKEWSIFWSTDKTGTLDTPMVGKFKGGLGEFYAQEVHDGKRVYSQFIWSKTDTNSPQWEQALSADGGRTWETNWIMEFDRVE